MPTATSTVSSSLTRTLTGTIEDPPVDDLAPPRPSAVEQLLDVRGDRGCEGRTFPLEDALVVRLRGQEILLRQPAEVRIGVVAVARAVVSPCEKPDDGGWHVVPGQASPAAGMQRVRHDVRLQVLDGLLALWARRELVVELAEQLVRFALFVGRDIDQMLELEVLSASSVRSAQGGTGRARPSPAERTAPRGCRSGGAQPLELRVALSSSAGALLGRRCCESSERGEIALRDGALSVLEDGGKRLAMVGEILLQRGVEDVG